MKEDLLIKIRDELEKQKEKNNQHNQKIKRINELMNEPNVKEYIKLLNEVNNNFQKIQITDKEIIKSIYRHYLHEIKHNETNGIYVYIGTYQHSLEKDIIHGSSDFKVGYNCPSADYRVYWNIEQSYPENIPIKMCEQFEKTHIIINTNAYFKEQEYYVIQQDFFTDSIKTNQEIAKKKILRKYNKLNK